MVVSLYKRKSSRLTLLSTTFRLTIFARSFRKIELVWVQFQAVALGNGKVALVIGALVREAFILANLGRKAVSGWTLCALN